jgi:hypothetical membrane protein
VARRAGLLGLVAWIQQPLYVLVEILIGLQASADYTFASSTVSDLGNTACRQARGDLLCSPWHTGMNAAFIWFGCTLAVGGVLLGARRLDGRAGVLAAVLWCVAGAGTIGVGLFPVNEDASVHGLVALPIFIALPLALAATAWSLRGRLPRLAAATFAVAAASAAGSIGFGVLVGGDSDLIGAVERLALWPPYVWVGVLAIASTTGPRRADGRD